MRLNYPLSGLLVGIILPMLGIVLLYFIMFNQYTFMGYINNIFKDGDLAAKVLSLALIANVLPIMYFSRKQYDYAIRGLMSAFVLYAFIICYLKFVV